MQVLGYDIGSSFVKVSVLDITSGNVVGSASAPEREMEIAAPRSGWAEQDPEKWWRYLKEATRKVLAGKQVFADRVMAIGISYQMHGLVAVDRTMKVLRPAIIWCDSRAVDTGNHAFRELGEERCLSSLLNSPGNFTASKLAWVKENEPGIFSRIHRIMLPGDYIALRMTGEVKTTVSGLSEGIFWDFRNNRLSEMLLGYFNLDESLFPEVVPTFGLQGGITEAAARELGLPAGIPVAYRAGDQPNNAFSLNVLNPGEVAATAGTSGVVYGVSEAVKYDPQSRVNSFAHVNHSTANTRIGVLLCINGTGILNSWLKRNMGAGDIPYDLMNSEAGKVPVGSDGLTLLPFGNGAERMLGNRDPGSSLHHLNFNIHDRRHLFRAAQEGIAFAFRYGMDIMQQTGINPTVIRAGMANMFLSPLFRQALSTLINASIELYNTDGSAGAARGAALGAGILTKEALFSGLDKTLEVDPDHTLSDQLIVAYQRWKAILKKYID